MLARTAAGEDLADGTDTHQRIAVRRLTRTRPEVAEAGNGGLAVTNRADDETRHAGFQKQHRTGEFHRVGEQPLIGGDGAAGQNPSARALAAAAKTARRRRDPIIGNSPRMAFEADGKNTAHRSCQRRRPAESPAPRKTPDAPEGRANRAQKQKRAGVPTLFHQRKVRASTSVVTDSGGRTAARLKGASWRSFREPGPKAGRRLCRLQVFCRAFARTLVANDFVGDLLTFHDAVHTGALDSGNVDENVLAAIIGLNETKTLGCVEPLNGTCAHDDILLRSSLDARPAGTCRRCPIDLKRKIVECACQSAG